MPVERGQLRGVDVPDVTFGQALIIWFMVSALIVMGAVALLTVAAMAWTAYELVTTAF